MRTPVLGAALLIMASSSGASAMSYGLISLPDGSRAVVAKGYIGGDETGRLLSFLQANASSGMPRTLVVSSPGGNMVSAIQLGETVRRLGMRTSVGSLSADASGQPVLSSGLCGSACVFVLMGGVSRTMRPGSVIGVHSPQISLTSGGRSYALDPATSRHVIRATEPILRAYARQMGVSPTLINVAHAVPHKSARLLSPAEINRYGLVTGGKRAAPRARRGSGKLKPSREG